MGSKFKIPASNYLLSTIFRKSRFLLDQTDQWVLRTTGLKFVLQYANKWSFTLPLQVLLVVVHRILSHYTLFVENVSLFHSSVSSIELDANSIFAVRVRVELELWSLNSTRTRSFEFELDRARILKAWARLELEVLEFELKLNRV